MEQRLGSEDLGCYACFGVDDAAAAEGMMVARVGVEGRDSIDVGREEDRGATVSRRMGEEVKSLRFLDPRWLVLFTALADMLWRGIDIFDQWTNVLSLHSVVQALKIPLEEYTNILLMTRDRIDVDEVTMESEERFIARVIDFAGASKSMRWLGLL